MYGMEASPAIRGILSRDRVGPQLGPLQLPLRAWWLSLLEQRLWDLLSLPICRSAEDCAIVFDAIYGPDGKDQSLIPAAFNYQAEVDFSKMRIGYVPAFFERQYLNQERDNAVLEVLKENGAELIPV